MLVDDLYELLPRGDALQDLGTERLVLHFLDEVAGNLEVYVGLEEGTTDLSERVLDIGLGKFPLAPDTPEGLFKSISEVLEQPQGSHKKYTSLQYREIGDLRSTSKGQPQTEFRPPLRLETAVAIRWRFLRRSEREFHTAHEPPRRPSASLERGKGSPPVPGCASTLGPALHRACLSA